jgi:hypothetical protein
LAFAFASGCRGQNRGITRSRAIIRQVSHALKLPFTCLLGTLFLISTFTAARPTHIRRFADSFQIAEIQAALGASSEEFLSSFCLHGDGNTSGIPDRDQTQPCKACPFCCGFHHLPLLPQRSLGYPAHRVSAALFPSRVHLTAAREKPAESRPRAPPLV